MPITIAMVSKHSAAGSHDLLVYSSSPGKGILESQCQEKKHGNQTHFLKDWEGLG